MESSLRNKSKQQNKRIGQNLQAERKTLTSDEVIEREALTSDKVIGSIKHLLRRSKENSQDLVSGALKELLNHVQKGSKTFKTQVDLEKSLKFFMVRGATGNNLKERIQLLKDNNSISGTFDPDYQVKKSAEKICKKIQKKVKEGSRVSVGHSDQDIQSVTRHGTDILLNFKNEDKEVAISHYAELLQDNKFKKKVINTLSIFNGNVQVSYPVDKRKYFVKEGGPFEMDFIWYVSGKEYKVTIDVSARGAKLISVDGNFSDAFKEAVNTNKDINALLGYEQDIEILKVKDDCLIKCLHIGEELSLFDVLKKGKVQEQTINKNVAHETLRAGNNGLPGQLKRKEVTHLPVEVDGLGFSDVKSVQILPTTSRDKGNHIGKLGKSIAKLAKENNQAETILGDQDELGSNHADYRIKEFLESSQDGDKSWYVDDELEDEQHTMENSFSSTYTMQDDYGYFTDDDSELSNDSYSNAPYDNQRCSGDDNKSYQHIMRNLPSYLSQLSNNDGSNNYTSQSRDDQHDYKYKLDLSSGDSYKSGLVVSLKKGAAELAGERKIYDKYKKSHDRLYVEAEKIYDVLHKQYGIQIDLLSKRKGGYLDLLSQVKGTLIRERQESLTKQNHVAQKLQEATEQSRKLFEECTNVKRELNITIQQLQRVTVERGELSTELANAHQELANQLKVARQEKTDAEQKLQKTEQEHTELANAHQELANQLKVARQEKADAEQQLQAVIQECNKLNGKVTQLQERGHILNELCEKQKTELDALATNNAQLNKNNCELREKLDGVKHQLQQVTQERNELNEKVRNIQEKSDKLTQRLTDVEQQLMTERQEKSNAEQQLKDYREKEQSGEWGDLGALKAELQRVIEESENKNKKLLEEFAKERSRSEMQIRTQETCLLNAQKQIETLTQEKMGLEGQVTELSTKLNNTTQQLAEEKEKKAEITRELNKRTQERNELNEKNRCFQEKSNELTQRLTDVGKQLMTAMQAKANAEQQLKSYHEKEQSGEWGDLGALKAELQRVIEERENNNTKLLEEFDRKRSQLEMEIQELKIRLSYPQEQIETLEEQVVELTQKNIELFTKSQEQQKVMEGLNGKLEESHIALSNEQKEREATCDKYWKMVGNNDLLKKEVESIKQALNIAQEELQNSNEESDERHRANRELTENTQKLTKELEAVKKRNSELEQELAESVQGCIDALREKIKTRDENNRLRQQVDAAGLEQRVYNENVHQDNDNCSFEVKELAVGIVGLQDNKSNKQVGVSNDEVQKWLNDSLDQINDMIRALQDPRKDQEQSIKEVEEYLNDDMLTGDSSSQESKEINLVRSKVRLLVGDKRNFQDSRSLCNALEALRGITGELKIVQYEVTEKSQCEIQSENAPNSQLTETHSEQNINNNLIIWT